jgi:hypothetical protein
MSVPRGRIEVAHTLRSTTLKKVIRLTLTENRTGEGDSGRTPPATPSPRRRWLPARPLPRVVAAALLVLVLWLVFSIGAALTRPGADSSSARLAEWARDHHLGSVVTWLEKKQYAANQPPQGGNPAGGIPLAQGDGSGSSMSADSPSALPVLAKGVPLPHEGDWQAVVHDRGRPAVQVAFLRPDDLHTSFVASLMWLDPHLLAMRLHPGYQDPGGRWATPDRLTTELQARVAAAFPAGFRLNGASRGGYYDAGRQARPLRSGAASTVIYQDGSVRIGAWGRDAGMTPAVRSVRQNLDLLVDHGQVNPSCSDDHSRIWGHTLGNRSFVARTALGQRADGSLIFVNSPATSVCSLGRLLQAAGVMRGMELDINSEWSIGYYYTHVGSVTTAHQSRPDQQQKPNHYFLPQSRDFLALYFR